MGLLYSLGISGAIFKYSRKFWYFVNFVSLLQVILSFAFLICRPKVLQAIWKRLQCCHFQSNDSTNTKLKFHKWMITKWWFQNDVIVWTVFLLCNFINVNYVIQNKWNCSLEPSRFHWTERPNIPSHQHTHEIHYNGVVMYILDISNVKDKTPYSSVYFTYSYHNVLDAFTHSAFSQTDCLN